MKSKLRLKLEEKFKPKYIVARARFLKRWTKIPEGSRKKFFSFLNIAFHYFQNAILLAIAVTSLVSLFDKFTYWKAVICIWFSLPFIEHYYVWFRENWKHESEDEPEE